MENEMNSNQTDSKPLHRGWLDALEGAVILVDPRSIDEIAAAMADLDRNPEKRRRMAELGLQRARLFSWTNCARRRIFA